MLAEIKERITNFKHNIKDLKEQVTTEKEIEKGPASSIVPMKEDAKFLTQLNVLKSAVKQR